MRGNKRLLLCKNYPVPQPPILSGRNFGRCSTRCEESQSLHQQKDQVTEQLAALAADNLRLSNLVALANNSPSAQRASSNELLKLRGEIARLRADARRSTQERARNSET